MAVSTFFYSQLCYNEKPPRCIPPFGANVAFDAIAAISLMVVGILGVTSVLSLSPAACYSMIGISGAIILSDLSSPFMVAFIDWLKRD